MIIGRKQMEESRAERDCMFTKILVFDGARWLTRGTRVHFSPQRRPKQVNNYYSPRGFEVECQSSIGISCRRQGAGRLTLALQTKPHTSHLSRWEGTKREFSLWGKVSRRPPKIPTNIREILKYLLLVKPTAFTSQEQSGELPGNAHHYIAPGEKPQPLLCPPPLRFLLNNLIFKAGPSHDQVKHQGSYSKPISCQSPPGLTNQHSGHINPLSNHNEDVR